MTTSKNTMCALLISVLSMVLCAAMLVGSTFAWFTDSVISDKNKIVAGNLDIELFAKDGSGYTPVTADTNLFMKDALWEPGHVEVINLKIANLGTLALKYRLSINIVREKGGTNVEGNDFQLSDYIQFALIDGDQTYASHEDAVTAAEAANPKQLSYFVGDDALDYPGVLYPAGEADSEKFVTLVVYMPTDVGNVANYKTGTEAPEIELGVTLLATQTPYESDSFNNKYDEQADYAVASLRGKLYQSIKSALADAADGDTIYLLQNAETAQINFAPRTSKRVTIDMCGKKISTVQNDNKKTWFMMVYKSVSTAVADVTFKNGTIDCYDNGFWFEDGAKLTLDNVKLTVNGSYSSKKGSNIYAIYLTKYTNTEGVTLLLKDSEITSAQYGIASWNENCDVTIDGCKIESNTFGVYQNGARTPATFTIRNSQITDKAAMGLGIYIPGSPNKPLQRLTVDNCTVTGATAIEVKHTDATITNSTLIASKTELSDRRNGSGSCTTGYALAVTSYSPLENSYPATGTVTATNCKLYSGSAEGEPNGHVFVYRLEEGASVAVNGNPATVSEKYSDEINP